MGAAGLQGKHCCDVSLQESGMRPSTEQQNHQGQLPCEQCQQQQLWWQLQGHLEARKACRWGPEAPPGCVQKSRCADGTWYHRYRVVYGICIEGSSK